MRAYSGTEAVYLLEKHRPDLILLDLMLPGMPGEELLPRIQGVPVIVVSARTGVDDKVSALLGGAADYITKPFEIKELLARITVRLRGEQERTRLTAGDLSLDAVSHEVTVCGVPVRLTKTEFAILKLLMQTPDRAVSRSFILENISEDTPDCVESSLKVHVSNLRRKLREVSGRDHIEAIWGIGFRLNP